MGEQLILEGLAQDLNTLPAGTQLQIGTEAVVELVKPRTGCDRFEAIQGLSPSLIQLRMGMMARVLRGGSIAVGDEVKIL
jgi:MOSC domain-containing protein YiiM